MSTGSSSITQNRYPFTFPLSGNFNTIPAIGGFSTTQILPGIILQSSGNVIKPYDLSQTVQIFINKKVFNDKLGNFNTETKTFPNDTIEFDYNEFQNSVSSVDQIVSVGSLSSIYRKFSEFVNIYFNSGSGLNSILSSTTQIPGSDLSFNASAFINVIKSGSLSGKIIIKNVNLLLQYLVETNIFGNRSPSSDLSISDNFKDGDLILIYPSIINQGISVVLDLSLDTSQILINTSDRYKYITNYSEGGTTTINDAEITKIKVTRTAPLLFILKD